MGADSVSGFSLEVVDDCENRRRELTDRYVAAIAAVGQSRIGGVPLAELLTVDGIDAWAASSLRESSLWTADNYFARITALAGAGAVASPQPVAQWRCRLAAVAYAVRALAQASRRRAPQLGAVDVVFVDYATKFLASEPYVSPYFGALPADVHRDGRRISWLHLTSSGAPTSLTTDERRWMARYDDTEEHSFLYRWITPRAVLAAVRSWCKLQRHAPSWSTVVGASNSADVRRLAGLLRNDYVRSVNGTTSMRTLILCHALRRAMSRMQKRAVVIHPFEGQGWEALLINECARQEVRCVSYLHTIVKPWDVRAATAVGCVKPKHLVVHGRHDEAEMTRVGLVPYTAEALRYQHLARQSARTTAPDAPVLFVGGADCEQSTQLFNDIVTAHSAHTSAFSLWVKWHPQCVPHTTASPHVTAVTDPLDALFPRVRAVILAATAAPLDSYLAGVPTCSVVAPGTFSTNPLTPDATYFVARDAAEAIAWAAGVHAPSLTEDAGQLGADIGSSATQSCDGAPDIAQWFVIDPDLPRWRALIDNLTGQRSDAR